MRCRPIPAIRVAGKQSFEQRFCPTPILSTIGLPLDATEAPMNFAKVCLAAVVFVLLSFSASGGYGQAVALEGDFVLRDFKFFFR